MEKLTNTHIRMRGELQELKEERTEMEKEIKELKRRGGGGGEGEEGGRRGGEMTLENVLILDNYEPN